MNKQDILNLRPTLEDCKKHFEQNTQESKFQIFLDGVNFIVNYMSSKLPNFTQAETLALEEYKANNKLSAVRFLMAEQSWTLKQTIDFLTKYSQSDELS
jgi:hypothetical protein